VIHARIREAQHRLVACGIAEPDAAIDAELLARHLLGWSREQMVTRWLDPAPTDGSAIDFDRRYCALIDRRAAREPVAYIIGHREFWGLEFEVTRDVLIPRPETELIVEEALALVRSGAVAHTPSDALTIIDVGTGSGCLAIALAHELPHARVIAIDVSTAALHVAKRNADRHGVSPRIAWHAGSVLEPIDRPVDLIVSNPPYVPLGDAPTLPPDVRDYEPPVALFSGGDGLATIRALVMQAAARVKPGGALIFEFGFGQAAIIREIITQAHAWEIVRLREDLQGIPRTAVLTRI
jgi:release factor glutamine methyltransferase